MRRWSFFIYGVAGNLLFLATYAYMAGFVGNFLVPRSIDSHPGEVSTALAIDLLLIALFAVPHSVMARPWFKQIWTRIIPQTIERSTYVYVSLVLTWLLMWQWQAVDITIWDVQQPIARGLLWGLFAAGWLLVPAVSLMINHFDLFGSRQVWLYWRGKPYTSLAFRTPWLYKYIRHPLYVGWTLAFWAIPTMTLGHLFFAFTMTLYMAIAVIFEERDLVNHFGQLYRAYQKRVPMVIPRFGASVEKPAATPVETVTCRTAHINHVANDDMLTRSRR